MLIVVRRRRFGAGARPSPASDGIFVDLRRILWKIGAPADDPRCAAAKELPDTDSSYRICLERHRVVYQVDAALKQVTVFRIANR